MRITGRQITIGSIATLIITSAAVIGGWKVITSFAKESLAQPTIVAVHEVAFEKMHDTLIDTLKKHGAEIQCIRDDLIMQRALFLAQFDDTKRKALMHKAKEIMLEDSQWKVK